jgi:hypothetical protein
MNNGAISKMSLMHAGIAERSVFGNVTEHVERENLAYKDM